MEFDKEMDDAAAKIQKHYRNKNKNKNPAKTEPEPKNEQGKKYKKIIINYKKM